MSWSALASAALKLVASRSSSAYCAPSRAPNAASSQPAE
jgi:hypothetical protein